MQTRAKISRACLKTLQPRSKTERSTIAAMPGHPISHEDTSAFMDSYRWAKRPLIVLAPGSDAALVRAQRVALGQDKHELLTRDMVWIEVLGNDVTINGIPVAGVRAEDLRRRYAIAKKDSRVLLVGKDGGVKLRRTGPISADELFATIDAMPMRRREIKTVD